jgi:hypothetical protein
MTVSANATFSGTVTYSGVYEFAGAQLFSGEVIHNGQLVANGNLTVSGGNLNVDDGADVNFDGTVIIGKNGKIHANNAVADGSILGNMIDPSLVADYMQVANTIARDNNYLEVANVASVLSPYLEVANTDSVVAPYLQVANVASTLAPYLEVANAINDFATTGEVESRIQVANAIATFATIEDTILTGNASVQSIQANTVIVTEGQGLQLTFAGNPVSSNASVEGLPQGIFFYSNTYLYIVTNEDTIKRIPLESF